ncbi:uncharacterized protein PADG_05015 [Paracoccidioides brasiliensis Pb18]|uniref:RNA polymerase II assembly factor Rtp1 C-terminal domain-containing protein n=1 Tax=Paracoccidioides brasiliensis (strain Pb18) TaxID=502780 RepID=C1GBL4_PARBD|nr:uncharacterized protein PADG_05015 [Paracoccidioides brasiliensis Pb18]EEH48936.2 hypothetical protein PADG_05015 [Paracoccidioides brasiliensis Pb18]
MGSSKQLIKVFGETYEFLKEIQKSRGDSLVQTLSRQLSVQNQGAESSRLHVIQRALDLLVAIHNAFVDSSLGIDIDYSKGNGRREDPVLEDTKRRRVIHGLLDLLSLEGVYPALSSGVGIPLEQRVISVLPTGVVARQPEPTSGNKAHDERLLRLIIDNLRPIICDKHSGIQSLILGRIIVDILCATAELAFHSQYLSQDDINVYAKLFQTIIDGTPTPSLLPILSTFIQKSSAAWFKTRILGELSQILLRKDGVFQTVIFIASQFAPALGQNVETSPSNGPPITVQAIMQTSRLLSSVPQTVPADDYFCNISPKLLALLDSDESGLQKTASYVIGSGILGKQSYGAPGAIGYRIFVKPIFDSLHGNPTREVASWLKLFSLDGTLLNESSLDNLEGAILIDEPKLLLSLNRLSALVLLHPNPGLLKRLIQPVLLPLWALKCYAKEHQRSFWYDKVSTLLKTFFSVSTGIRRYKKLADHILWDGGKTWTYGPGQEGGISVRKRTDPGLQEQFNPKQLISLLDGRIDGILELLSSDPQSEELVGDVFLYVSQVWLLGPPEQPDHNQREILRAGKDLQSTLQKVTSAKFTEKLLDKFKDSLCRHPDMILGIIEQLIRSGIVSRVSQDEGKQKTPSSRYLGNMVESGHEHIEQDNTEESESLSAAFSLLSTILTSPDFSLSETLSPVIQRIKAQLGKLLPKLPRSLVQPATTASMLLEITLTSSFSAGEKSEIVSSRISDLEIHRQVLEHLSSPLPPIKAEGLALLSRLITESSPVLDIPATLALLLSLITNSNSESSSNDEFIYINVIKIIGVLASKHPRTVVKTLTERYADRGEEYSLDQRLRIGEALLRTVQELGGALVEDTAKLLGETMIAVAGRRGRKPSAKRVREEISEKELKKRTGGGGGEEDILDHEAADLMQQIDEVMDPDTEDPARITYSVNIINAWAAGAASDLEPDDLRVRSSAMSILASAIQTNIAGLGPSILSSSIDLAISTLNLERGPESAILRRAAVVLLLDLVKALDMARENGVNLGFGFSYIKHSPDSNGQREHPNDGPIGNIPDMLRVLTFVESNETDPIVRGHIRVLIESLEAWLEKSLLWGVRSCEGDGEPRFELRDQLAGLDIHPHLDSSGAGQPLVRGPRIEEIE